MVGLKQAQLAQIELAVFEETFGDIEVLQLLGQRLRLGGLLLQLEQYYRSEIPREKLFDQISSGAYVVCSIQ